MAIIPILHSSVGKESACNAGDPGLIPGSRWSPAEGIGNLLQYSCLGSPMDRGPWRATVHGVAKVGHDFVTKPTNHQPERKNIFKTFRFILEYSQLMFDSFVWTSKRLSHRHACIHSPPASPPIQTATSYWEEFPVLYSKMEINCKSSLQRTKFLENTETSFFRGRMLSEVSLWAEDKVGDLAVVERRNQVIIGGVALGIGGGSEGFTVLSLP